MLFFNAILSLCCSAHMSCYMKWSFYESSTVWKIWKTHNDSVKYTILSHVIKSQKKKPLSFIYKIRFWAFEKSVYIVNEVTRRHIGHRKTTEPYQSLSIIHTGTPSWTGYCSFRQTVGDICGLRKPVSKCQNCVQIPKTSPNQTEPGGFH